MDNIKEVLKSKLLWGIVATMLVISQVVNANKETNTDLLNEYYTAEPTERVQEASTPEADAVSYKETTKKERASKKTDPLLLKADSLAEYAKTLLGKGYSYGKIGPDVFDCSGYIYHVFNKFNISLPHSSRAQAKLGEPLSTDEIRKGDLLFFKSPTQGNPNIGHVGIAIENNDGNIKFIHSSTNRGVTIDSLGSRHYGKRFMEARRILL